MKLSLKCSSEFPGYHTGKGTIVTVTISHHPQVKVIISVGKQELVQKELSLPRVFLQGRLTDKRELLIIPTTNARGREAISSTAGLSI